MKICVVGAGAIGGFLAAKLAAADEEVSVIARGPHLEAIRARGLRLRMGGEESVVEVAASDDPADLGPQDYVIVTLKAHSFPPIVERLKPLLAEDTAVVTAINGVPFWYFHGLDGPWRDRTLEAVDPGGVLWKTIGPGRAIGAVVYPACDVPEPGVVQHLEGDRFTLGEPTGEKSERATRLSKAMIAAGLKAPVRKNIRDEVWVKLWGNVAFNPISALTLSTLVDLATDPDSRAVARAMMLEMQAVAEALGARFVIDVDKRLEGAEAVGAHRTSMLQDLEKGRPMEIDALVTAVTELGRIVEVPTPTIDVVLHLVRRRAREAGCYPPA
jgi:2-dehydropantoate 2-reductase